MKLHLRNKLIFVNADITYQGNTVTIPDVLVDTGAAASIFDADYVVLIGIRPQIGDILYEVRGVGGSEAVYARHVDSVQVAERRIDNFEIEIGGMDYGYGIHGILGLDFLIAVNAIIDLQQMEIKFG